LGMAILASSGHLYAVEKEYQPFVERLRDDVKNRSWENMSTYISLPLSRKYPVPAIRSKAELKRRFDELFDAELTQIIVASDAEKDWSSMGWRGVMLHSGIVWLDYDGRLIAINHQSAAEKALRANLIRRDKEALHQSLRSYEDPIFAWQTTRFKIRLDDIGGDNYRYASWSNDKTHRDKPDLVLSNGVLRFDGSGGNHTYTFRAGTYAYILYVNHIGASETSEGELRVFKDGIEILHDAVVGGNE